jgi:hypothetical protein
MLIIYKINLREQLQKEKEFLASEGRYLEAENIRQRINEIKSLLSGQKKKDLSVQHIEEIKILENTYNRELYEFNEFWEKKIDLFNEKAKANEETLALKQRKELEELISTLEQKLPKTVKFSKEYLDLKQSEFNLVKQERYVEAHQIKTKCDIMESKETEKYHKERNEKIRNKSEQLAAKQFLEKNALKQKLDKEFDELKKEKESELEKIFHKFKNRRLDLELQQKHEKVLSENVNLLKASNSINFYKFFRNNK